MSCKAALRAQVCAASLLPVLAVAADESSVRLAEGAGLDRVQAYCSMCHSLDYIQMNSPFQDRAAWDKTVTKMVKVMGAPIPPEDSAVIVDYLARLYGVGTPASPQPGAQ